MNLHNLNYHEKMQTAKEYFAWPSQAVASADDEALAEVDEPPDHQTPLPNAADFHRSTIRPVNDRKESLLTKALLSNPEAEFPKAEIHVNTDLTRRRSTMSNASVASTADLTSDGGLTSPARTNTPSPPFPQTSYINIDTFPRAAKTTPIATQVMVKQESQDSNATPLLEKIEPTVEALTKKRCITFACGGPKPKLAETVAVTAKPEADVNTISSEPPKRACTIKFACQAKAPQPLAPKPADTPRRRMSRSPVMTRKPRGTPPPSTYVHRDSNSTIRGSPQSPQVARARKPKYITGDEQELNASEATRFHEFASGQVLEDDWISKDVSETKERLTINDTLKKENAIRQLGKEAEEEALEDEEEDEDEEDNNDSDDDNDDLEDEEEEEYEDEDENSVIGSDYGASDGNETDNEAGFADSDDESDAGDDMQFWTPGKSVLVGSGEPVSYRACARRTASESSIDSLKHMSPGSHAQEHAMRRKPKKTQRIRIRPGTPDLPDSTDFVCGTLDEDRPLEDAYVSCMEARKREKRQAVPQDIDPSFPTSDPEQDDEEDDDVDVAGRGSEEDLWIHGKFEASDEDRLGRRKSTIRKSPKPSPKRHHSPPPPRTRHRSPPPRRLFAGHSPRRTRSPPLARAIKSPTASPTIHATSTAIAFAPLGQRPGLTHTKSLPRTPNAFCQQYRASKLAAANIALHDGSDDNDGHTRSAIDIVKGLERKRQRRKEKLYKTHCNRARKAGGERKPQPGKGAERMRELGLQMAGKGDVARATKAKYVLSI